MFFRWKSSLWKLVWRQLLVYLVIYFSISLLYRLILCRPNTISFNPTPQTFRAVLLNQNGDEEACSLDQNQEECNEQRFYHRHQFEKVFWEIISVSEKYGVGANQFLLLARWWNGFALENDCLSLSSSVSTFHLLSNGSLKKEAQNL